MHAKILRTRVGAPQAKELYYAFNLSIFCQEWPAATVIGDQPSSSQLPSPLSNP